MRLTVPCPLCQAPIPFRITVLNSTVRDGEELHEWSMDTTAVREHAERHTEDESQCSTS